MPAPAVVAPVRKPKSLGHVSPTVLSRIACRGWSSALHALGDWPCRCLHMLCLPLPAHNQPHRIDSPSSERTHRLPCWRDNCVLPQHSACLEAAANDRSSGRCPERRAEDTGRHGRNGSMLVGGGGQDDMCRRVMMKVTLLGALSLHTNKLSRLPQPSVPTYESSRGPLSRLHNPSYHTTPVNAMVNVKCNKVKYINSRVATTTPSVSLNFVIILML
jgi:hypothetical protein